MLKNCTNITLKDHDSVYIDQESIRLLNDLIHIRVGQLLKYTLDFQCDNIPIEKEEYRESVSVQSLSP